MPVKQMIFLFLVFLVSLSLVLRMILKNQLKEVYAVIWVVVVLLIPVYILCFPLLEKICSFIGVFSVTNFSTFLGLGLLFGLSLHFSALNSDMQRNLKNAIQKIAILEAEIRKNEGLKNSSGKPDPQDR